MSAPPTQLEQALASIVRRLRAEAEARAVKLERRIETLEQRAASRLA